MEISAEQGIEDGSEESKGSASFRKFKYSRVFKGENWIPARMGEIIYRAEIDATPEIVFVAPNNDSNAAQRLVTSYTHRFGIGAAVLQCKILFEDSAGNDVTRRGVVVRFDSHPESDAYRLRMEIEALNSRRQEKVEMLYRLMSEAGVDPATHNFSEPFVGKDGIEIRPLDYVTISDTTLKRMAEQRVPEQATIGDLFPLRPKRSPGRPKKVAGVESPPRTIKTPSPFLTAEAPKRRPGRPKRQKT